MEKVATKFFGVGEGKDQHRYQIDVHRDADGKFQLSCPGHPPNTRGGDVHATHLYESGRICIAPGKEATTMDQAVAQAMGFCEGYSQYLRTGAFPNGRKRVRT